MAYEKFVPTTQQYGNLKSRLTRYILNPPTNSTLKERILFNMTVDKITGCWEWTGGRNQKGYGRIGIGQAKLFSAHRISYREFNGPLIDGLDIDHVCENRGCVNPAHLQQINHRDNIRKSGIWRKRRKTHCPHGHPYRGANLIITKNGYQSCRQCNNEKARKFRESKNDCT